MASGLGTYLNALRLLKIYASSGSKDDLDITTKKEVLSHVFFSTDDVIAKIKGYTIANTTFTGAITPRPLFHFLKEYLLAEIKLWSQFEMKGSNWELSGNSRYS